METDLFQSCGHCWVFQICWYIEYSTLTASSFRIWNNLFPQGHELTWRQGHLVNHSEMLVISNTSEKSQQPCRIVHFWETLRVIKQAVIGWVLRSSKAGLVGETDEEDCPGSFPISSCNSFPCAVTTYRNSSPQLLGDSSPLILCFQACGGIKSAAPCH